MGFRAGIQLLDVTQQGLRARGIQPHKIFEGKHELFDLLGGFAIAAHPGSQRPGLRWQDWTLPVGGLEGPEFIRQAERILRHPVNVLSGTREAELAALGVEALEQLEQRERIGGRPSDVVLVELID